MSKVIVDRGKGYYQARREELAEVYATLPKRSGWVPPAVDAVSKSGKPLVRLVLDAFGAGRLTPTDVSEYLGVRLKHLAEIQKRVSVP